VKAESGYPWNGTVAVTVLDGPLRCAALESFGKGWTVRGGTSIVRQRVENGYRSNGRANATKIPVRYRFNRDRWSLTTLLAGSTLLPDRSTPSSRSIFP